MARKSATTKEEKTPKGGLMEVRMSGTPDEIREQLDRHDDDEGRGPEAQDNGSVVAHREYVEALRNAKNIVVVKRLSPRKADGVPINVEVYREQCPLDPISVEQEVEKEAGGKKFRAAVIDSESGQLVAAHVFTNDLDPVVQRASEEPPEWMREEPPPPSPLQMNEEALDRQSRLAVKQIEYEQLRQQLESLKDRKAEGRGDAKTDARIREIESQLIQSQADKRVSEVEMRYREEISELRRKLDQLVVTPLKTAGEDPIIKLMMEQNRQANDRFEKLLGQMQDSRMAEIQRQLSELKNKPQQEGSSLKEAVATVKDLMEMMGHGDDGDDKDDDDSDKPFLERLADRYLPKIFDMIESEQEKTGKTYSKDEVVARINQELASAADKAAKEEVARRIGMQQRPPAPAPTQPDSSPLRGAVPNAAAPAPAPAPAQKEEAPERKIPSLDEEVKMRAAAVVAVLERELALRPRAWQWTFAAWENLPESILEKLTPDGVSPDAVLAAFEGMVNPGGLEQLRQKVTAEPKMQAWMARGIAELNEWGKKAQADPNFNPGEDGEDEGGEED